MFYRHIDQDIALEEQNACIAGSAAVADLLYLHLRLDVIGKRPESAGGIAKAGCFDLHFAAIAAVSGAFHVGEAVLF